MKWLKNGKVWVMMVLTMSIFTTPFSTGVSREPQTQSVTEEQTDEVPLLLPVASMSTTTQPIPVTSLPSTVVIVEVVVPLADELPAAPPEPDKTMPIYKVFKNGCFVDVPAELQWLIRDLAVEHDFDEKLIFGMILAESTFNGGARGDSGKSQGLAQIQRYWLSSSATRAGVPRFTETDPTLRNLLDPHDNLITLMEIWSYAREVYKLDLSEESGMLKLLYWHNTGNNPSQVTKWAYATRIFGYMAELEELQLEYLPSTLEKVQAG